MNKEKENENLETENVENEEIEKDNIDEEITEEDDIKEGNTEEVEAEETDVEETKESEEDDNSLVEVADKDASDDEIKLEEKQEKLEKKKETKKEKHKKEKKLKEEIPLSKVIALALVAVVVIAFLIIGILLLVNKGKEETQEVRLENRLKVLAKEFYEDKYYPNLVSPKTGDPMTDDEKKEYAARFEETGITMGLESLARVFGEDKESILKEFINEETKEACNAQETKVIIYPKRPYKADSYDIEVVLDCGFKTDEKKEK